MRGIVYGLVLAGLAGCSSAPDGVVTPPPPPPSVGSVTFIGPSDAELGDGPRGGDVVQFTVRVRDTKGQEMPGEPVVWSTGSSVATIDQQGLLAFPDTAIGGISVTVQATAGGKSATRFLSARDWRVYRSVDAVTLEPSVSASIGTARGSLQRFDLVVECRGNQMLAYVVGSEITRDGSVELRFSGADAMHLTWNESTNFKALFIPPGSRGWFTGQLETRDTLHLRYNRFPTGEVTGHFVLREAWRAIRHPIEACS